ncbi:phage upper tail fiber protein [Paenirhodobacter populi]|uniref:Minor tail protein gp31 C-terminal domain-containing protein n=1 Tax=Paenirhodobacter populi TaxID=2306993 RepID=A0A443IPT1_9RHOB|nr:hypothetical protein [Sinirhodobacter populi]RWR08130.1 hypothetical protein D2T33_16015 [Sinirhodobacter populi]
MSGPTQIIFALRTPTGEPVTGGKISFALSGFDLDDAIVVPETIEAPVAHDGTGSVSLWPNISGLRNTFYKITVTTAAGTRIELGPINVPESQTAVEMHRLVPLGTLGGLKTLVLTQADYDTLAARDDQTLYLIRAEE